MSGEAAPNNPRSSERRPPWVSPEVASIGAASFFSDAGHEIATAVVPSFLTGVLRGSAATLGLIEGLSDALLGLAKLVSGPLANQPTRRVQLARGCGPPPGSPGAPAPPARDAMLAG
jgi:hypothetical protein